MRVELRPSEAGGGANVQLKSLARALPGEISGLADR